MSGPSVERRSELVLRVSVIALCLGLAARAWRAPDVFDGFVFLHLDASEPVATHARAIMAWLLLAAAAAVAVLRWASIAGAVGAWVLTLSIFTVLLGGPFSGYAPGAHAARAAAGFGLALLWLRGARPSAADVVLRVGIALTFAFHGLEALAHKAGFQDLLFMAAQRVGVTLQPDVVPVVLTAIGVQDLLLAAMILLTRWRVVAGYMVFWGALTAMSRFVHSGWVAYPDVLVRIPNAGVPLALWFAARPPLEQR